MINRKEKEEYGCVVRSLESGFCIRATDEEWQMRLDHFTAVDALVDRLSPSIKTPYDAWRLKRSVLILDQRLIREYLELVSEHRTPLGNVLRAHNRIDTALQLSHLVDEILHKKIVLGHIRLKGEGMHMAHLGWRGRKIVSLSDQGLDIPRPSNGMYPVMVFTPK